MEKQVLPLSQAPVPILKTTGHKKGEDINLQGLDTGNCSALARNPETKNPLVILPFFQPNKPELRSQILLNLYSYKLEFK